MRVGVAAAARRAKLPRAFRQHDLRHTRVTRWLSVGKPPTAVMKALGHSSLQVTLGYYRFTIGDLATLADDALPTSVAHGGNRSGQVA